MILSRGLVERETIGKYSLGKQNARDDRLAQFCTEKDLLIANSFL